MSTENSWHDICRPGDKHVYRLFGLARLLSNPFSWSHPKTADLAVLGPVKRLVVPSPEKRSNIVKEQVTACCGCLNISSELWIKCIIHKAARWLERGDGTQELPIIHRRLETAVGQRHDVPVATLQLDRPFPRDVWMRERLHRLLDLTGNSCPACCSYYTDEDTVPVSHRLPESNIQSIHQRSQIHTILFLSKT